MNFTLNPGMVRGELFTIREGGGGKWKYTVQIDMSKHWDTVDLHEAVVAAYLETPSSIRGVIDGATGYQLFVPDPYHRHAHPICVVI